nr:S1 RNA-binding domain-containing protein [Streptomyces aurantiogriseus]
MIAVDVDEGRVQLSTAATENPELWAFLASLRRTDILTGAIAAIERFGVFVALDDGPDHPVFPGVGFITFPELSWRRFEAASDVVQVGRRVSCEFLQFDTWNGEARLSLRATQPDPFPAFADDTAVGRTLHGKVTKLVPFGVFVQVADGIEGLVPLRELTGTPVDAPEEVVQVGDEVTVVVTEIDRERRRMTLSRRQTSPEHHVMPNKGSLRSSGLRQREGSVGIELELHSGRPARGRSSRDTLVRGSYQHGETLARALSTLDRHSAGKLGWIDPYGDTLFNEQEAQAALQEVAALAQQCTDEHQKAALLDLAELLEACAATPGSYLWFIGD